VEKVVPVLVGRHPSEVVPPSPDYLVQDSFQACEISYFEASLVIRDFGRLKNKYLVNNSIN
jgi:hypothetical protein